MTGDRINIGGRFSFSALSVIWNQEYPKNISHSVSYYIQRCYSMKYRSCSHYWGNVRKTFRHTILRNKKFKSS